MRWLIFLFLVGLAPVALAQNVPPSPPPPESLAARGLVLALQQMGVSAEQYVTDMKAQFAAKDARVAELEAQKATLWLWVLSAAEAEKKRAEARQ